VTATVCVIANGGHHGETIELTSVIELSFSDLNGNPAKLAAAKGITALWDTIEPHVQVKARDVEQGNNSCFYYYRAESGRMFYAKVS
jgi:hypothetical protein